MRTITPSERRKIALDAIYVANLIVKEYPEVRPDFIYAMTFMQILEDAGRKSMLVSGHRAIFLAGVYLDGNVDAIAKWVVDKSECYWVLDGDQLIDLWPVNVKALDPMFDIGDRTLLTPPGYWMDIHDIEKMPYGAVWKENQHWMTPADYLERSPAALGGLPLEGGTPLEDVLQSVVETAQLLSAKQIHEEVLLAEVEALQPIDILTSLDQVHAESPNLWLQSVFHANMTIDDLPLDVLKLLTNPQHH